MPKIIFIRIFIFNFINKIHFIVNNYSTTGELSRSIDVKSKALLRSLISLFVNNDSISLIVGDESLILSSFSYTLSFILYLLCKLLLIESSNSFIAFF